MTSCSDITKVLLLAENSAIRLRRKTKGKYGVHPINRARQRYGKYHHLFRSLRQDKARFLQYTRMSIETFGFIIERVKNRLEKKRVGLLHQVIPEERLVVTLRFLATGASFRFRHLAFEFRLGRITVSNIIFETCKIVWLEFQNEFLPTPTEENFRQASERFYTFCGFPNCFGAIDSKHCHLKCPPNSGSSYFSYLKYFSIVLLAVADADKRFMIIEVGSRGKQSDGGIFLPSQLFKKLQRKEFNVPSEEKLPATNIKVPFVLIGDEAFPLLTYLMRPYPEKVLTPERETFNDRLSRARKAVECAFGILRAKWRFLCKEIELPSVKKASMLVQTACAFNNLIREKDGINDPDYNTVLRDMEEEIENFEHTPEVFRNASLQAKVVREEFTRFQPEGIVSVCEYGKKVLKLGIRLGEN